MARLVVKVCICWWPLLSATAPTSKDLQLFLLFFFNDARDTDFSKLLSSLSMALTPLFRLCSIQNKFLKTKIRIARHSPCRFFPLIWREGFSSSEEVDKLEEFLAMKMSNLKVQSLWLTQSYPSWLGLLPPFEFVCGFFWIRVDGHYCHVWGDAFRWRNVRVALLTYTSSGLWYEQHSVLTVFQWHK